MNHRNRKTMNFKPFCTRIKSAILAFSVFIILAIFLSACGEKPAQAPPKAPKKQAPVTAENVPAESQAQTLDEEKPEQEGYIYQQKDRRDPFVPLIVPKKKVAKVEGMRAGNLVSYDIGDFTLAAIAKKGEVYFALVTTPDNRSFTVTKGTPIGLYKGKVQEITKNQLIIVEYSSDYSGELKPRKIILEFHKGEVE